jgi:hypothetical protein
MRRWRTWLRLGAKTVHDIASIGFGGALAACMVINLTTDVAAPGDFLAARHVFAAIAKYVLMPALAVSMVSGLIALAATRGYQEAGWAWLKALLGLSVFMATLHLAGFAGEHGEIAAAASAADLTTLQRLLRAERITLWVLMGLSVVNVVLAVWRPRLTIKIR